MSHYDLQSDSTYKPKPAYLADVLQPDIKKAVNYASGLFSGRRTKGAVANLNFYEGDHWQRAEAYIGAKPVNDSLTMKQIEQAFVSENVIKEVVDRHVGGILGREPLWGFVPQETVSTRTLTRRRRFAKLVGTAFTAVTGIKVGTERLAQEADEAVTIWWDQGQPKARLKQALVKSLTEERALLRLFVPRGLYGKDKLVPVQPSLTAALKLLHVEVVSSDRGGVFCDADTQQPFAVYTYEIDKTRCVELSYVDELGQTILQILSEDPKLAVDPISYDMQGLLWMHELQRCPLITEQIRSEQKALNLALTMLMRNVNLAGNLERVIMNAEPPKRKLRITDPSQPASYREEIIDSEWLTGPGVTNSLTGLLIRNDKGEIVDRANPNISYRDPVPIDTFVGTRQQYRECILGQAQQSHMLISGDATVSGRSREQARAEYRSSLLDSKDPLDGSGRWLLESGLRIAAVFSNRVSEFARLRCDFESRIEDGPISPDERSANREDVKAGLLSKEAAMSRNGVEDTDAEKERIEEDRKESQALAPPLVQPPSPPPNGDSQLVQ